MFSTACRISEARRLDWPEINFKRQEILITKTKIKKQRLPHMPQRLLVKLANLPRDDKPFGCWSESSLRRFWDDDIEKTAQAVPGFKRLPFHSCRHGFATTTLRTLKIDPKTAAELGGWDDVTLFMETYAHAIQDYTEAIRLSPKSMDAYRGRAMAEQAMGDTAGAAADRAHIRETDRARAK